MKELDEQSRKALRESDDRKEIADRLLDQKQEFDSILEDIKEVVRQAEETEPLLSQQLYDTYREASRGQTREAIDATENLLSRGFFNEARKTENTAGEGVDQLNRGIQQAAEDIVGDESDSLRRAEQTLQKLTRQINSEIRENSPDPPAPNSGDRPGEPENRPQPGEPGPSSAKNGKQQDGDEQPGERKGKNQSQGKKSGKGAANPRGASKKAGQASGQGKQQPNPSGEESSPRGQGGKKQASADPADANGQKQGRNDPGKQGGKQSPGKSSTQKKQNGKSAQSSGSQPGGSTQTPDPSAANPSPGRDPLEGYQRMFGGPSNGGAPRPITGDQYRQFSNDLREIEELLEDPKLRARAAEIREKAREIRVEMKRHSRKPNWDVVQDQIAEPLEVLRSEVARQLLLRENREALVPIDRDPVPTIFEEQVREYYRELSEVEK